MGIVFERRFEFYFVLNLSHQGVLVDFFYSIAFSVRSLFFTRMKGFRISYAWIAGTFNHFQFSRWIFQVIILESSVKYEIITVYFLCLIFTININDFRVVFINCQWNVMPYFLSYFHVRLFSFIYNNILISEALSPVQTQN